ncbi:hypothetical protein C8J56DRAFT_917853 [Mycena floridula]|nr:hypothetical protein C8J56DRAFT_917853 [Mycena floridula]
MFSFPLLYLISSWFNTILYTAELIGGLYILFKWDIARGYKFCIWTALVVDGLATICTFSNAYLYCIIYRDSFPMFNLWPVPVQIITQYVSACITQGVFVYRYWSLSRNQYVTVFLGLMILLHLIWGIIVGVVVAVHPIFDNPFGVKATAIAAATCAATDLFIAISLVFLLGRIKTSYRSTSSLLRRLSIQALTCGVATSAMTVLMLILFFIPALFFGFQVVFSCMGRIYTLTLICNIILLRLYRDNEHVTHSTQDLDQNNERPLGTIAFSHTPRSEANSQRVQLQLDDSDDSKINGVTGSGDRETPGHIDKKQPFSRHPLEQDDDECQ